MFAKDNVKKTFRTMTNEELKVCEKNVKQEDNRKINAIYKITKQREKAQTFKEKEPKPK